MHALGELLHLPAFRDVAEGGWDAWGVFVAGVAEVDEPFAVEVPGLGLEHLNPPLAVLDQLVVGGEDPGDALLLGE